MVDEYSLREIRTKLEISIKAVADQLGVHPTTVARWERGDRRPSGSHISALARTFGLSNVEVADLLDFTNSVPARLDVRAVGLRRVREVHSLAANDIATMLGVPTHTIYNWEAGSARMPVRHLATLSKVMSVHELQLRTNLSAASGPSVVAQPSPLRALRIRHGLTQHEVARSIGVSRWSIGRWESGEEPPLHAVRRLARLYRRSTSDVASICRVSAPAMLNERNWRPTHFDQIVRALRHWRGLSQVELAAACMCSKDAVRAWERGRAVPRASVVPLLEEALGLHRGKLADLIIVQR